MFMFKDDNPAGSVLESKFGGKQTEAQGGVLFKDQLRSGRLPFTSTFFIPSEGLLFSHLNTSSNDFGWGGLI